MASMRPLGRAYSILSSRVRGLADGIGQGAKRRIFELDLVRSSLLFDRDWYLESYPDVAEAGIDPLRHYMTVGWREGRDPGPFFSTLAYLRAHADVRRSAGNPLLHFVEFGQHEGRKISGHLPLPIGDTAVSFDFAPPNDCATFPRERLVLPAWCREYRLDRCHRYFVGEDDVGAGYAPSAAARGTFQGQFTYLRELSGYAPASAAKGQNPIVASGERLVDAWYVSSCQLRTRWTGDQLPFVVRGFQCDPFADGRICLVGESLVTSASGFLDLHLKNAYFPVLITFAAPEGQLRGSVILAFPSLCRGGTHYAELLEAEARRGSRTPLDAVSAGLLFAQRLVKLIRGEVSAAVSDLEIDLSNAAGSSPLLQREFRLWLERVGRLAAKSAGEPADAAAAKWLGDGATVTPIAQVRPRGATLRVSADAVPTIAAVTATRLNSKRLRQVHRMQLLVTTPDPSEPATSIELPAMRAIEGPIGQSWSHWPCLAANDSISTEEFGPAAIRFISDELSDADLFLPRPDLQPDLAPRDAVTWLIRPEEWPTDLLSQAISAAALQDGSSADEIVLVGNVRPAAIDLAKKAFGGEIRRFANLPAAAQCVKTSLFGFIGGGVLLHDRRSASFFASLLRSDAVATASCVLISAEKRGSVLCSAIVDGGATLVVSTGQDLQSVRDRAAKRLWRHTYPVLQPSPGLWMTRSSQLAAWSNTRRQSDTERHVVHLCSSVVTATFAGENPLAPLPPFIPTAEPEHVATVKELVG